MEDPITRPSALKPACSTSRNSSIERSLVKKAGRSPVPRIARKRSAAPRGRFAVDPGTYSGMGSFAGLVQSENITGESGVGGFQPLLQGGSPPLRSAQLRVDRGPELLEKRMDLQWHGPHGDTADDLLPARLV